MTIFIFSNFFPYERPEPFLVNEFRYTREHAGKIHLASIYGTRDELKIGESKDVYVHGSVFASTGHKNELLWKGLFNFAPVGFHFRELFLHRLFIKPAKLYWFFVSLLMCRSIMSSKSYKSIAREIAKSTNPVLYFYWSDNWAWIIPYLITSLKGKRMIIVMRLHGSDLYEYRKAEYSPIRNYVFEKVDMIMPVSENGYRYLTLKYPAFRNKMELSRLGVEDHGVGPYFPSNLKVIVSVSNLVKIKRVHLICEALCKLGFPVVWHHFGDGPLFGMIEELAEKNRGSIETVLHGYVSNDALMDFYSNNSVDVFVNVSSVEGLPVSIMEAMSFGIPVVATDAGGTSELVNGENGELLPNDPTAEQIAKAINHLLSLASPEIERKRARSRLIFENLVNAGKNYEEFYRKLEKASLSLM